MSNEEIKDPAAGQPSAIPDLSPKAGWVEAPSFRAKSGRRSFVSGDPQGDRIRIRFFRRLADNALVSKVWFGPGAEGPPGHAHGGSLAAVLDSIMGRAAWMSGHQVLAAELVVRYRRMVPLSTVIEAYARVVGAEGRKVRVEGRILGPDGLLSCEGQGLYIELAQEQLDRLALDMPGALESL